MIVQTFVATLVVLPFFTQSALAHCARNYTVQAGDICDSISKANNVSTYQLAATNAGIIDAGCTNLIPGNTICLGWIGQDCTTTYVVADRDSCDGIVQAAGINMAVLHGNNPQINQDCSNIYTGEVLCTSNQNHVSPAPAGSIPPAAAPPPAPITPPSSSPPSPTPASRNDELPWCDEL